MKKFYKNENASISLYAIVTVLTFILVLGAIITSTISVRTLQLKTMPEIKMVYEKNLDKKYEIYAEEVEKRRDKVPPEATITVTPQTIKIGGQVTVNIKQSDNKDRLDLSKCKYVCNTTATSIGTNSSSYASGTYGNLGSAENTVNITFQSAGTFYVHVLTVDMDKNSTETISVAIQVTQ